MARNRSRYARGQPDTAQRMEYTALSISFDNVSEDKSSDMVVSMADDSPEPDDHISERNYDYKP
jgi:hypothetical protein